MRNVRGCFCPWSPSRPRLCEKKLPIGRRTAQARGGSFTRVILWVREKAPTANRTATFGSTTGTKTMADPATFRSVQSFLPSRAFRGGSRARFLKPTRRLENLRDNFLSSFQEMFRRNSDLDTCRRLSSPIPTGRTGSAEETTSSETEETPAPTEPPLDKPAPATVGRHDVHWLFWYA